MALPLFDSGYLQQLAIALPAILLALTLHEVAHGWVADRLGDPTARLLGRLSLNPLVHLDPMGTLAFALSMAAGMGFGWAKPVPVDPRNLRRPRRDMMWVALAGPAVNFALAILSAVLFVLARRWRLDAGFVGEPAALMLQASFSINTALAAFNLIPILPFDGGRILAGLLPLRLAWPYSRSEPYGFFVVLGLILLGWLHLILWPIYTTLRAAELWLVRNLLQVLGLY
ncbi:MAG: site-2 protease family protein [Nitrospinota bacterium]